MQLNIHFRRLQEMFLYVHNVHRGKTIQEQYNRKICGVLRKYFFLWLYSIFFWYSNINNSNLYDAPRHQRKIPQMCMCMVQNTLHRQIAAVYDSLGTQDEPTLVIVTLFVL